jgi:hypothetical protein
MPHDDPLTLPALFEQVGSKSLGTTPDVVKGVILGYNTAPTIRAECDSGYHKVSLIG